MGVFTGIHSPPVCGPKSKVGALAGLVPAGAAGEAVFQGLSSFRWLLAPPASLGRWMRQPTPALLVLRRSPWAPVGVRISPFYRDAVMSDRRPLPV